MSIIIALKLNNRMNTSDKVQNILSLYGCYINFRIGFHDTSNNKCTNYGIILLEFTNDKNIYNNFIMELSSIDNLEVKTIKFT